MSLLDVPGAQLYHETRGDGPLLVLVPGANGDARVFTAVAEHLAQHHTVVTYDRRGFSRSILLGAQDYDRCLQVDADDVARLIEHHGGEPAIVFGTSSGAVIALEVLVRHPSLVRTLAPHETAAMKLLPDGQEQLDFLTEVYALYRRSGIEPALRAFRERLFPASDRAVMTRATDRHLNDHAHANLMYWFERELRQYTTVDLDLDTLANDAERIVPLVGEESRGYPAYRTNVELAHRLERHVIELPGGHTGFATQPHTFAPALLHAIA